MKIVRFLGWWSSFLIATFAMSKVFEASRQVTAEAGGSGALWSLVLWLAVLAIMLLGLGYDAYAKAKAEGKLVHQVWLFEKVHQLQQRESKR